LSVGKKRISVTGAAGFAGSHLCEKLADAGHEVLCIANAAADRAGAAA